MQQMTNILLSKMGNTGTSPAQTSSQGSNSEGFSSTLASVTASSFSISTPKKMLANVDEGMRLPPSESAIDGTKPTDEADINLIFAQIGMANEMKKTASGGEKLPSAESSHTANESDSELTSESILSMAPFTTPPSIAALSTHSSEPEDANLNGQMSNELTSNKAAVATEQFNRGASHGALASVGLQGVINLEAPTFSAELQKLTDQLELSSLEKAHSVNLASMSSTAAEATDETSEFSLASLKHQASNADKPFSESLAETDAEAMAKGLPLGISKNTDPTLSNASDLDLLLLPPDEAELQPKSQRVAELNIQPNIENMKSAVMPTSAAELNVAMLKSSQDNSALKSEIVAPLPIKNGRDMTTPIDAEGELVAKLMPTVDDKADHLSAERVANGLATASEDDTATQQSRNSNSATNSATNNVSTHMSANLSTNISTDISEHEQATSDELSLAAQQSRSANSANSDNSDNDSATSNISANLSANISTDVGEHELATADELSVAAQQNPSANSVINNISADVSADELATSDELSVAVPQNPSANSATNNISANMGANMSIDVSEHKLATSADERHLAAQQSQNAKVNSANTPADIISPQIAASLLATPTLGEPSAQDSTDGLTEVSDMDAELSKTDMGASTLLKDAKLSVTLDTQREVKPFVLERNENISTADIKPLSSFSLGATTPAQVNSQESMQVQLSLRQGVEQQNQMQEMIQRFSPVMKQQLITMVSQGIQHAEIRLDPPELGHMLVKIQVHGEQTQVQFHVTQTQTRDLVEQAMPRLRELLQEQGMQLADSHVSQGDQGQRREGSFGEGGGSDGADVDEIPAEELHLGLNQATSVDSGIDYYA